MLYFYATLILYFYATSRSEYLPEIHSSCPLRKSFHHYTQLLIKKSILECSSLILIPISILPTSNVNFGLLYLFYIKFIFQLYFFFFFALEYRKVHTQHWIFVISLTKTKHLMMHFSKI